MNSPIKLNDKVEKKFQTFLEKSVSRNYLNRWRNLFVRGVKGWAKIDIWDAWNKDFTSKEVINWKRDVSQLPSFLKGKNVSSFIFLGMGHNPPLITDTLPVETISHVLKNNVEGIALTNDENITLIMNHDGEIMIINSK